MTFSSQVEALSAYVAELVQTGLNGWEKIVVYKEMVVDGEDGYLKNAGIAECWVAGEASFEYKMSFRAEEAAIAYFESCVAAGKVWSALRLEINADESVTDSYFFESYPLLSGNYEEAERRLGENPKS